MKVKERCSTHLISSRDPLWIPYQLRVARLGVSEQPVVRCLEKASSRQPPVDPSSTSTLDLCWMLPSASVLACRREERVQKAVSVDHHGPGDARLSAVLNPLSGVRCDYVPLCSASGTLHSYLSHALWVREGCSALARWTAATTSGDGGEERLRLCTACV